jgi:hypothetical protein
MRNNAPSKFSIFFDLLFKTGFIPIWARFAPTATIQLLTIEVLYDAAGLKSI